MAADIVLTVLVSAFVTEFFGYWLHILLHSNKVEFLSRNHMIHHLVVYAPNKPMRPSAEYVGSTYDRANVLGIGLEWTAPVGVIIPVLLGVMRLLGVQALLQGVFIATALTWGWLMFGYMHDAMHLQNFWMEKRGALGRWFLGARRAHDIHHMRLEDDGRNQVNFGICFFLFDRLFGTYAAAHSTFNRKGHAAALRRYAYVFPKDGRTGVELLAPKGSR